MRGVLVAIGGAIMWFIIYASYALAFWYGVKLIMDDREGCLLYLKECLEDNLTNATLEPNQTCQSCPSGFDPASLLVVRISQIIQAVSLYNLSSQDLLMYLTYNKSIVE